MGLMLMSAAAVRADYQSTVLGDNPLAYYALNPASDPAGVSPDLTGNGNNGAAANIAAVPGPTAYITNAASFDGQTSAVDLGGGVNSGILNFSGPITMEAWAQPADTTEGPKNIIAKGYDSSVNSEITLRANAGNYLGGSYNGGTHGASGGQQSTNWTYLVCAYDGTNWSLYVNAALVQRNPDATGSLNFSDPWRIGTGSGDYGSSRYFSGNISEVALYTNGLTAAQVLNHFYFGELNSSPTNSAPIIISQPQPQSTFVGGTVTFSVGVVSAFPTTNQWSKNNFPLPGKTNATLTISGANSGDAANYSVVVGNGKGTTNSASASLTLLASGNSLKWSPTANTGVWDTTNSANWINLANSLQTNFNANDQVLFDDTVGVPTNVTVNGTVSPSVFTVNSSANNFNIAGGTTPQISGAGSLVKQGSSLLTITSPANFTGPVAIKGGTIYAGNNCFSSVASITITNNATLDMGGGTFNNNKPIIVSGTGVNGQGAIFNSYSDYPQESLSISLTGDTTFGGSARWDLASGSQITGAHNLTIDWSAQGPGGYGEWNTPAIAANVLAITLTNGSKLGLKNMDTSFQNPGAVLTVGTNGQAVIWNGGFNGSFHLLNAAQLVIYSDGLINGSNVIFENGTEWDDYGGGTNDEPVNSAITLNGVARFVIGDHNMVFTNLISGVGGFVSDAYNHQFVFSASNTYAGPTIIGSGPQVALTGIGSISHSSLIFFGGGDSTVVHVDVSGRTDKTLKLASGQTLAGIGTVNGSLVVSAGAILSPAGTNTTIGITSGTNATGTITATNAVTLNGTTVIKLNGSGVNDQVQAGAGITYGGSLNLVNISGSPLAAGNSFQIASAASYTGLFASITPATPGAGLAWDTSQLNIGFLNVVSGPVQPVISSTRVLGGNLIFSGTGGTTNGNYSVLTTTNITTPQTNWTALVTNSFDANGAFSVTNAISAGTPQRFYRLKLLP
jgi:autotransporter-associated beta strand protein